MLANVIQTHAAAAAAGGDWAAVATALNTASIARTSGGRLTSLGETLARLLPEEREPMLAAFNASLTGRLGLQKLAAVGLDYAHPLTVGLIQSLDAAAALPAGVAAKLLSIGTWSVSPAANAGLGTVTADQCQQAWQTEQLRARLINAAALATERMSVSDTAEQQAATWATAWAEAV